MPLLPPKPEDTERAIAYMIRFPRKKGESDYRKMLRVCHGLMSAGMPLFVFALYIIRIGDRGSYIVGGGIAVVAALFWFSAARVFRLLEVFDRDVTFEDAAAGRREVELAKGDGSSKSAAK